MRTSVELSALRGRLAPSPTGYLHVGNAWSFLLCWLAVRAAEGTLILRMEDIDPERSSTVYADAIMADLEWMGLDWDEGGDRGGQYGPYVQSQRLERYAQRIDELARDGHTYPCYCTRKELRSMARAPHATECGSPYPGWCRDLTPAQRAEREAEGRRPALRLRLPHVPLGFVDALHGEIAQTWEHCGGDFPLRRSDGVIAYQLAVAVDDMDQRIGLVVRGEDLLHCTPRQVALFRIFGVEPPVYAHVPLVFDHVGQRLAKRHHSLTLHSLREAGITPMALTGYLGFRAGLLPELAPCSVTELATRFSWARIPRVPLVLAPEVVDTLRRLS